MGFSLQKLYVVSNWVCLGILIYVSQGGLFQLGTTKGQSLTQLVVPFYGHFALEGVEESWPPTTRIVFEVRGEKILAANDAAVDPALLKAIKSPRLRSGVRESR